MRRLLNFILNPVLFGLGGVGGLVAVQIWAPRYIAWAGVAFLIWAIAVGINYAFGGNGPDKSISS